MAYQLAGSSSSYSYHSPFGDTTFTKVFVGGLAWETSSDTLRRHFEPFGDILEAVVITDKHTGRSKGYGFVTFRDPESARRACADPTPVIDGRRANCNLASLGRLRPPSLPPYGRLRPSAPIIGGVQSARGPFVGNFGYQQPLSYHQGVMYPPYGYAAYGSEYVYPQGIYNPYLGQQYLQMYGVPGAASSAFYPYGQLGQTVSGTHGYTSLQGYAMPSHQIMRFGGPNVNPLTTATIPSIQAPYSAGIAAPVPAQPQFIVPASPQFIQGSGPEQTSG